MNREKLFQNRADSQLLVTEIMRVKGLIQVNRVSNPVSTILHRYLVDLQMQYRINESQYQTLQGL